MIEFTTNNIKKMFSLYFIILVCNVAKADTFTDIFNLKKGSFVDVDIILLEEQGDLIISGNYFLKKGEKATGLITTYDIERSKIISQIIIDSKYSIVPDMFYNMGKIYLPVLDTSTEELNSHLLLIKNNKVVDDIKEMCRGRFIVFNNDLYFMKFKIIEGDYHELEMFLYNVQTKKKEPIESSFLKNAVYFYKRGSNLCVIYKDNKKYSEKHFNLKKDKISEIKEIKLCKVKDLKTPTSFEIKSTTYLTDQCIREKVVVYDNKDCKELFRKENLNIIDCFIKSDDSEIFYLDYTPYIAQKKYTVMSYSFTKNALSEVYSCPYKGNESLFINKLFISNNCLILYGYNAYFCDSKAKKKTFCNKPFVQKVKLK